MRHTSRPSGGCPICKVSFEITSKNPNQRFCSPSCAMVARLEKSIAVRAERRANANDAPLNSDAELYPQTPTTLYTETCSMCGETEDKVLTDQEARALRPTRCVRCGGRVLVDTALLSSRSAA